MTDPLVYARFVHLAATLAVTGVVFFVVLVLEPAMRGAADSARLRRTLRAPLAGIAWAGLILSLASGAAWLVLTAASMSGQTIADALSADVLWTVLSQTTFGTDWLLRFVFACGLAAVLVRLLSAEAGKPRWLQAGALALAAAFVGGLAWAGHGIGGQGLEGFVHPAADVLHLIAAAVWLGTLAPLALLLGLTLEDAAALAVMRTATLRFSALGVLTVGTLLATGMINTWYLVGSPQALLGTDYGRLLLLKIALFLLMVSVAAINRSRLTPKLVDDRSAAAADSARRQLRRNAAIEASLGAIVIAIVAMLGVLPPASHSHHHTSDLSIPADATFQHIHSEQGMADIVIEPGRVGTAAATIRLWNEALDTLDAREVTLTLTPPNPGSKPKTYAAARDEDGNWKIDGIALAEPGNWSVAVDAALGSGSRLALAAEIVIDAK